MSKIQTISVISFLAYSILIGALVFSRGFLLNRKIVKDKAGPCLDTAYRHHYHQEEGGGGEDDLFEKEGRGGDGHELLSNLSEAAGWCNQYPVFKKAILILVDALRHDFVGRMPFLSQSLRDNHKDAEATAALPTHSQSGRGRKTTRTEEGNGGKVSSCMFRFVADPPTTTMQRLKALMTGTMPTFIDASANFNSYEVEEDSLIYQLHAAGKRLAFLGDDTWLSLFPASFFTSQIVEAHPSFNAWDLDTVDRAVNHSLRHKVFSPTGGGDQDQEWDVLIAHLLGVDHCGHRYGPSHPEMQRKLNEADEIIEFVQREMSEDTLLVIFGDHGMTHTGDHGGDSKDETEAALVFISKLKSRTGTGGGKRAFQCPSFSSGGISQIDLVPTLATLLGVPIPYSSIGQLIPNFLTNKRELYTDALSANSAQVERYIRQFGGMMTGAGELQQEYDKLQQAFHSFQLSRTNYSARAKVNALAHRYLTQVKLSAGATWTQFNVPIIYTGVTISGLAILSLGLYLVNVPSLLRTGGGEGSHYSVLSWLWPSLPLWSVLWSFMGESPASSNLLAVIISSLAGLIVFLVGIGWTLLQRIGKPSSSPSRRPKRRFFWGEVAAFILYFTTCLAMFSNSFVINEGAMLGSTLSLVVFLHIVFCPPSTAEDDHSQTPQGRGMILEDLTVLRGRIKCSTFCFLLLSILLRTSSIFFRCREELQECTEEYLLHKQLSSLPEDWLVHKYVRYSVALLCLAIFVVAFRLWMLYQKCLQSRTPAALIAKFIPSLLVVLLGVFWALQGLPFISSSSVGKLKPILNYFPWLFQAASLISLVLVWVKPVFNLGAAADPFGGQSTFQFQSCRECALAAKKLRLKSSSSQSPPTNVTSKSQGKPSQNGGTPPPLPNTKLNGLNKPSRSHHHPHPVNGTPSKMDSIFLDMEHGLGFSSPSSLHSSGVFSSIILLSTLVIILLTQITSVGIAPAVSLVIPLIIVCLVGIFRDRDHSSWIPVIGWTLASQYLFYGTGHQPIFSAIPWDSAFLTGGDGQMFTEAQGSFLTWLRPGLAILGNLHVSQIVFSLALPLMAYWNPEGGLVSCQLHSSHQRNQGKGPSCHSRRRKAYVLCGKFVLLHGLKLFSCMLCAAWHRRHLMVWKIFAPKFIFELISFIVTTGGIILSLVFITRVDYLYHRNRHKFPSPSPPSN